MGNKKRKPKSKPARPTAAPVVVGPSGPLPPRDSPGVGWRAFAIDDGQLLPAWVRHFWPDRLDVAADRWRPGMNWARCLTAAHDAPAADCTCGFRVVGSLPSLLDCLTRTWRGSERPVAGMVDAIGRVKYPAAAVAYPGVDIGDDDPPSTVRVHDLALVDLWLAPALSGLVGPLSRSFGVPVHVAATWADVDPQPRLEAALAKLTLPGWRTQPEVWVTVSNTIAGLLREGMSRTDGAVGIFDSPVHPTWEQAKGVVDAVIEHLAPDTARMPDMAVSGRSINVLENIGRHMTVGRR